MKHILDDKFKWIRVVVFACIFMFVPMVLEQVYISYEKIYYQTAPITNFYENIEVLSSDVCYGEQSQHTLTHRYARGTTLGWGARADKGMFMHVKGEIIHLQQYDVKDIDFFVEVDRNGVSSREVPMPILDPGEYHWEIYVTELYLPYGVVRYDVQQITGSTFRVIDCDN